MREADDETSPAEEEAKERELGGEGRGKKSARTGEKAKEGRESRGKPTKRKKNKNNQTHSVSMKTKEVLLTTRSSGRI